MEDKVIMNFLNESYESRLKGRERKIASDNYCGLVSWYFNLGKNQEDALVVCARKAYDDFKRNLVGIGEAPARMKKNYRSAVEHYIKERIEGLQTDGQDFNTWHNDVCNGIIFLTKEHGIDQYLDHSKNICFTYGLAQKWLNMTLKYALIMKLDNEINLPIKDLHVPVDRYILQAASKEKSKEFQYGLGIQVPYRHASGETPLYGKYSEEKTMPWSKWEPEDYKKFQEDIKTAIKETKFSTPIEWEGEAWIAIAHVQERKIVCK